MAADHFTTYGVVSSLSEKVTMPVSWGCSEEFLRQIGQQTPNELETLQWAADPNDPAPLYGSDGLYPALDLKFRATA